MFHQVKLYEKAAADLRGLRCIGSPNHLRVIRSSLSHHAAITLHRPLLGDPSTGRFCFFRYRSSPGWELDYEDVSCRCRGGRLGLYA